MFPGISFWNVINWSKKMDFSAITTRKLLNILMRKVRIWVKSLWKLQWFNNSEKYSFLVDHFQIRQIKKQFDTSIEMYPFLIGELMWSENYLLFLKTHTFVANVGNLCKRFRLVGEDGYSPQTSRRNILLFFWVISL